MNYPNLKGKEAILDKLLQQKQESCCVYERFDLVLVLVTHINFNCLIYYT